MISSDDLDVQATVPYVPKLHYPIRIAVIITQRRLGCQHDLHFSHLSVLHLAPSSLMTAEAEVQTKTLMPGHLSLPVTQRFV